MNYPVRRSPWGINPFTGQPIQSEDELRGLMELDRAAIPVLAQQQAAQDQRLYEMKQRARKQDPESIRRREAELADRQNRFRMRDQAALQQEQAEQQARIQAERDAQQYGYQREREADQFRYQGLRDDRLHQQGFENRGFDAQIRQQEAIRQAQMQQERDAYMDQFQQGRDSRLQEFQRETGRQSQMDALEKMRAEYGIRSQSALDNERLQRERMGWTYDQSQQSVIDQIEADTQAVMQKLATHQIRPQEANEWLERTQEMKKRMMPTVRPQMPQGQGDGFGGLGGGNIIEHPQYGLIQQTMDAQGNPTFKQVARPPQQPRAAGAGTGAADPLSRFRADLMKVREEIVKEREANWQVNGGEPLTEEQLMRQAMVRMRGLIANYPPEVQQHYANLMNQAAQSRLAGQQRATDEANARLQSQRPMQPQVAPQGQEEQVTPQPQQPAQVQPNRPQIDPAQFMQLKQAIQQRAPDVIPMVSAAAQSGDPNAAMAAMELMQVIAAHNGLPPQGHPDRDRALRAVQLLQRFKPRLPAESSGGGLYMPTGAEFLQ